MTAPAPTPIVEVAAIVSAPMAAVRDTLYARLIPPDGTRRGVFTVEDAPGHRSTAEVDDTCLVLQGGWWYRGEWTLESPADDQTLVRHTVSNVATRARWGVGLANKFFIGYDRQVRESVMAVLSDVAGTIGAPPPTWHTPA